MQHLRLHLERLTAQSELILVYLELDTPCFHENRGAESNLNQLGEYGPLVQFPAFLQLKLRPRDVVFRTRETLLFSLTNTKSRGFWMHRIGAMIGLVLLRKRPSFEDKIGLHFEFMDVTLQMMFSTNHFPFEAEKLSVGVPSTRNKEAAITACATCHDCSIYLWNCCCCLVTLVALSSSGPQALKVWRWKCPAHCDFE